MPNAPSEGQALWTLQLNPVFSTALFGGYLLLRAENDTDSELNVAEGEAGLVYSPEREPRIRGGIGYADRQREATT